MIDRKKPPSKGGLVEKLIHWELPLKLLFDMEIDTPYHISFRYTRKYAELDIFKIVIATFISSMSSEQEVLFQLLQRKQNDH